MWSNYKQEEFDENGKTRAFLTALEKMGVAILPDIHTSGHSDDFARDTILNNLQYDGIIPIHTINKELLKEKYDKVILLEDNEEKEICNGNK
ncbi:MAG: hypothetical protein LBN74_02065 [Prevotella sp.]|jgi:mRNA degradation ribonuclease J1/J2|nr:hypothetical protein [Prevotella sp.]